MQVDLSRVPGVLLLRVNKREDRRGYVYELYSETRSGLPASVSFVQDNICWAPEAGTIRGLHFQSEPAQQAKLITVLQGSIFDVVVDLRPGSETFRRWAAVDLSATGDNQLFLPAGLAHGFCTTSPDTTVMYKLTAPYEPSVESGIRWNDPALGIAWPVSAEAAVLSDRDKTLPLLSDLAI